MPTYLNEFSLLATNLKSFGPELNGFESIKTINLIVGRNNSGKSALIDLIAQATRPRIEVPEPHWHKRTPTEIYTRTVFSEKDSVYFPSNTSGGIIRENHHEYGKKFVGAYITVRLDSKNQNVFHSIEEGEKFPNIGNAVEYFRRVSNAAERNPMAGLQFYRLAAERNVVPEKDEIDVGINENGGGVTNVIQHFINKSHRPSELVEETLLAALNAIFSPDATFLDIICQQHNDGTWEIYLNEDGKGRIALSQSGSGLKTIILALCYIHLLPAITKKPLDQFVFAFEELENNLHPALQRRLLAYVAEQARVNDFAVFLTTHSSVAIDLFNRSPDAQIIHVVHNGQSAKCKTTQAYIDNKGILDDLDVRASDLLQSNGIIWVEGPSDRIYINRWIEIWSNSTLVEGNHYQCIFYGGRLLAHISAEIPTNGVGSASLLRINSNAAIVIDSDKRAADDEINETKKRLIDELAAIDGFCWVTEGREIENYIPSPVIAKWLDPTIKFRQQKNPYMSFFEHLDTLRAGMGRKFSSKKPFLAEELGKFTTREDLCTVPGLSDKLDHLCQTIRQWNRL